MSLGIGGGQNVVTVRLVMDTSQANVAIDEMQAKIDAQAAHWRQVRQEVETGLRNLSTAIGYTTQIIRIVARQTGQALDQVLMSLLGVVDATVSAMLAVAAGYTATGILAPIGAALAGFTAGFAIGTNLSILARSEELKQRIEAIEGNMSQLGDVSIYIGGT